MRKILSSILVLALLCSFPLTALGATVVETIELPRDLSLSSDGCFSVSLTNDGYRMRQIVNTDGEALTPPYYDITSEGHNLASFIAGIDRNNTGLMNTKTCEIILPAEYADIDVLSAKWAVGIRLNPDASLKSNGLFTYYGTKDILDLDVYYGAQKVATLTADEWGDATAYGEYLMICNNTNAISLAPSGEKTIMDQNLYYYEFKEDYSTGKVIHTPTGQEAFVPGCTLTTAEVDEAYWMKEVGIVDLQGNVILAREDFPYEDLSVYDSHGDYLIISHKDEETSDYLCGVMDKSGKIIVPCVLIDLPYRSAEEHWFTNGVLAAITNENKLTFYDAAGTVLSSVELGENEVYNSDLGKQIVPIECPDGTKLYASAAKGLLDLSAYEEVYDCYSDSLLNVKQNGAWGVMDQNGEVIIPLIHNYILYITDDGTMAQGCYYNADHERFDILYMIEP